MIKVVTVNGMREADNKTIQDGTPSITLMLRAAESIYQAYQYRGNIAIVCGLGNNGGDGFALAEIMLDKGHNPTVYRFNGQLSADAEYYYNRLLDKGLLPILIDNDMDFNDYDIIVDCIFGTGMSREVLGLYSSIIDSINKSQAYIVSADIPSGLNGDNGRVMGVAVRANLTVSIGAFKTGHFLNDGKDYTGELVNHNIGIETPDSYYLVENKDLEDLFSRRQKNINKGSAGKLLIIGGSAEFMGAMILAERGAAALRVGAGLNALAIPSSFIREMMLRITTSTLYPMPDDNGRIIYNIDILNNLVNSYNSIAIGMGIGNGQDNIMIIKHLLQQDINLLIDADGLNAIASDINVLKGHKARLIITPHPKEMSRLTGYDVNYILSNLIQVSKEFATEYNVIVLLKGVTTVVTNGKDLYLVDKGSPAMAKGGSGDVLSGIIGGLLARGIEPFISAYAGAYISGRAGEIATIKINEYSALPTDTVNSIAEVINEIMI